MYAVYHLTGQSGYHHWHSQCTTCHGDGVQPLLLNTHLHRRQAAEALWQQVWIVQEAILPQRATIHWGLYQLAWDLLDRAWETLMLNGLHDSSTTLDDLHRYTEFWDNGSLEHLTAAMVGLKASTDERLLFLFWLWRSSR